MDKEIRENIFRKRPGCEICKKRRATELHHCLVHDCKRYHDVLTVEENLMAVCSVCHTSLKSVANGFDLRVAFARRQIERGYKIREWYRGLPLKVKEDWLLNI